MLARDDLRIPFEVAITEPRLLQPRFQELSLPQRSVLKATYGVPFDPDVRDADGFSEADHFAATQGYGDYDEVGHLIRVHPYPSWEPREFPEAWLVCGVRAGKSELAAFISTYEATCGGHEGFTRKGKRVIWFQIAQDIPAAQYALHAIKANLDSMAFMAKRVGAITARRIDLWNGVTITTSPPTVKSVRGYDSPGAVMDEVGVWWQEAESANPDFEIYRQLKSRQAQFRFPKIVGLSSPWNQAGMLYERWLAGTNGAKVVCEACQTKGPQPNCEACTLLRHAHQGRLVLHATTASLGNPLVTEEWLRDTLAKDPRAFARECLAQFQSSLSGFLDPTLLREAVDAGVRERPPSARHFYVAALDPAFRRDSLGFAICHAEEGRGIVFDVLRRRTPAPGEKLNPIEELAEIARLCKQYRVAEVLTDQHHFDSLAQLALQQGLALREITFSGRSKAAIYGSLQQLLNTRRLRLLDHAETLRELLLIERENLQAGTVRIAAPRGEHDDMATVVALAAHGAIWLLPATEAAKPEPESFHTQAFKQVEMKRRHVAHAGDWD